MMRPGDLVVIALRRIDHAEALLGPVDIAGITELSPSWRPMLHAMAMSLPAPYPSHGEGDGKFLGQTVRTVVHLPAAPSLGGPG